MLALGLVLLMAAPDRLDFQTMTSPAYAAFALRGETLCPARRLRYLHPADLDELEEDFLDALPRRDRRRVHAGDAGGRGCAGGGASCPAQQTLAAIEQAGLIDAFTRSACASTI